jgi:Holliday junction resolvase
VSTKSKVKGTRAESEAVKYLLASFPAVERRTLSGSKDKGDIAGIPNCVGEVKAAAQLRLAEWQRETLTEMANADAANCFLVVKVPYKNVSKWDFWMPAYQLALEVVSDPMEARWVRMDFELGRDVLRELTNQTRFL